MLVVALNVGPLFFSFVPSLNNDACEPFALKKKKKSLMWQFLKKTCSGHPKNAPEGRKSYQLNSKMSGGGDPKTPVYDYAPPTN